MTGEEEKTITREKHPGHVAQGHKLAALMKKKKEEILRDKQQSSVQPTIQSTEQSSVQPTVQSTEQHSVQSTVQSTEQHSVQSTVQFTEQLSVQSNRAYVYGIGIFAVLAISVCTFFAYKTSQAANKK